MTDPISGNKSRTLLFVSIAANIFLVAFTLGRFSAPGFMPPHGMREGPPPFAHHGDFMPPPPPSFGPDDLFSPEEMQSDETQMRENFDKIRTLRKDFAARLESGPVSKDDAQKHFADINRVTDTVRTNAQTRAADKISAMSPEDRHRLAQSLLGGEDRR